MDDKKGGIKTKIQSSQRKRNFRKVTRGNAVKGGIESETSLHALNMIKRHDKDVLVHLLVLSFI